MKRIKANAGSGAKRPVEYRSGRPPPAVPVAAPAAPRPVASYKAGPGWLGAGLIKIVTLGGIVIGGVAVVLWLRDMGSAAGVNWVH